MYVSSVHLYFGKNPNIFIIYELQVFLHGYSTDVRQQAYVQLN